MASVIWVECNGKKGSFSLEEFKTSNRSKCITCEGKRFSPAEFEAFSGRGSAKKWRHSLKYNGRPIEDYLSSIGAVSGKRKLKETNEEADTSRLDMNGLVEPNPHSRTTAGGSSGGKRGPSPSRVTSAPRRRRVRTESTVEPQRVSSVASDDEGEHANPQRPARGLHVEVGKGRIHTDHMINYCSVHRQCDYTIISGMHDSSFLGTIDTHV